MKGPLPGIKEGEVRRMVIARVILKSGQIDEYELLPDQNGTPIIWRIPNVQKNPERWGRFESYGYEYHIESFRKTIESWAKCPDVERTEWLAR